MAKIVILYSSAGLGLAKDARVLQAALLDSNYKVELQAFSQTDIASDSYVKDLIIRSLFKFNVIYFWRKLLGVFFRKPRMIFLHLENIHYKKLYTNAIHVLIPNQEWFRVSGISLLPHIHQVWCKTHLAYSIFTELGVPTRYIGFSLGQEEPLYIQSTSAKPEFFSRIGRSAYRGAEKLVSVWSRHPEWPTLNLVIDASRRIFPCPANLIYVDEFLSVEDYHAYANSFLFHLYATETEGFGHSIYESMRAGAIVLLTDAPPMNEIVTDEGAVLIPAIYSGNKGLSPRFSVTQRGLEYSVFRALELSESERSQIAAHAKSFIGRMDDEFRIQLHQALMSIR
jgi:glycosyltransferase involved in cell wall biosynthesis